MPYEIQTSTVKIMFGNTFLNYIGVWYFSFLFFSPDTEPPKPIDGDFAVPDKPVTPESSSPELRLPKTKDSVSDVEQALQEAGEIQHVTVCIIITMEGPQCYVRWCIYVY